MGNESMSENPKNRPASFKEIATRFMNEEPLMWNQHLHTIRSPGLSPLLATPIPSCLDRARFLIVDNLTLLQSQKLPFQDAQLLKWALELLVEMQTSELVSVTGCSQDTPNDAIA